jgi:hypothetical protein
VISFIKPLTTEVVESQTHLAVLLPNSVNVLESSVHVSSSTGDKSGIVVSLAPEGLESLVGLRGGLLELVGSAVEIGLGSGVGLDGLVDTLRESSRFDIA